VLARLHTPACHTHTQLFFWVAGAVELLAGVGCISQQHCRRGRVHAHRCKLCPSLPLAFITLCGCTRACGAVCSQGACLVALTLNACLACGVFLSPHHLLLLASQLHAPPREGNCSSGEAAFVFVPGSRAYCSPDTQPRLMRTPLCARHFVACA
jgi:hypothetical protein